MELIARLIHISIVLAVVFCLGVVLVFARLAQVETDNYHKWQAEEAAKPKCLPPIPDENGLVDPYSCRRK